MDDRSFAALSKRVAQAGTRRGMARALVGGLAAAVLGTASHPDATEAAFGFCHLPGDTCKSKKKCCSGKCKGGICGCAGRGHWCINRVGVICCSGKCRNGKCK
jgi:hypothetical protein